MLIFGGYKFLMSEGNPEKVSGAIGTMKAAVIGLVIVLSARILTQMIGHLLGVQIF